MLLFFNKGGVVPPEGPPPPKKKPTQTNKQTTSYGGPRLLGCRTSGVFCVLKKPPHTAFVPFVQSSTKRCIGNYISLASQLVSAVVASFIWGLPPCHGLLIGEREREGERL